ncbi:hypothetical protein Syun_028697 [Stephania yunnanensis]|uniref:Uncharacterized protein n=1 Tax=Stephania yunnanensis TaxID=152371 RepID=A0AAP0EC02_9MAGN
MLRLLVSFVSVTALVHVVTGRVPVLSSESTSPVIRPRLYTAWIMLCTLQVCVGLGIEGTIAAGVWSGEYDGGRVISLSLLSRALFFIGLHETMVHWSRVFVRPVVDDTIFGGSMDERWLERAVIGVSYGGLWWWRLREEAEGLVLMVDVKGEFSIGTRIADNLSWCLYYLTVIVAAVKLAKGLVWLVKAVFCCSRRKASYGNGGCSLENTACKV